MPKHDSSNYLQKTKILNADIKNFSSNQKKNHYDEIVEKIM